MHRVRAFMRSIDNLFHGTIMDFSSNSLFFMERQVFHSNHKFYTLWYSLPVTWICLQVSIAYTIRY
jgi:hypothetical protein